MVIWISSLLTNYALKIILIFKILNSLLSKRLLDNLIVTVISSLAVLQ